ncbi:MAG: ABC transporter ATP-binding protein, partial [Clostridiales bacterium]|nr:ABC transporter ATP-binding protein [Clostridiales bacterium]
FGLQRGHAERFSISAGREEAARRRAGATTARMNAALAAISGLSYLAVLLVGALFVYRRLIDWGAVIALMGLRGGADMLFVEAGQFMAAMQVEVAGIARLFGVQDEREEGELPPNLVPGGDALAMEGVSFAYEGGAPVLDRFSMAVRCPGVAALIGESGRGKSTAMKLILGLYRPDEGEVTFAAEGAPATLRGQTAYVPQEPLLFRGTIFENIAAGRDGATMGDVVDAAKRAGAHQFILEKPDGYRTELLDDGGSLSGGQRQRIAIARALVKGAPVLLLDEPTSALDGEREAEIFDTIREIGREKAVLLISHRPAVRQWADRVYEMR